MNFWTEEEDNLLRSKYGKIPRSELRKEFPGRSSVALTKHARRLGLVAEKVHLSPDQADARRSDSRKRTYYRARVKDPRVQMFGDAKRRAKNKNIEFSISVDDIVIPTHCPIFGLELAPQIGGCGASERSPSLDRKDVSKGYAKENVWVISYRANRIKNDATLEELEMIIQALKKVL